MTEQENKNLMYSTLEDQVFFIDCIKGLPVINGYSNDGLDSNGVPMCFGVGSHSVRCLREISETVKPKSIFEIGFNVGGSSALWLELNKEATIFSCDISNRKETEDAADMLTERYNPRFTYANRLQPNFTKFLTQIPFDLVFIDGGHLYDDVERDISICITLEIPYMAFDDILPEFGEVHKVLKDCSPALQLVKELGNIALYRNTTL